MYYLLPANKWECNVENVNVMCVERNDLYPWPECGVSKMWPGSIQPQFSAELLWSWGIKEEGEGQDNNCSLVVFSNCELVL